MVLGQYKKYSGLFIFLVFIAIFAAIVLPFFAAVAGAAAIAILVNPFYQFLKRRIKSEMVSSLLVTLFIVLVVVLPAAALINTVVFESGTLYTQVNRIVTENAPKYEDFINTIELATGSTIDVHSLVNLGYSYVRNTAEKMIISLPSKALSLLIMIFLIYYFLKDQKRIITYVDEILPFEKERNHRLLIRIGEVVNGVLYGVVFTAFLQGMVAGIGYYIFGLSAPIFLGILTGFCALIPFLGTGLVWIPASLYIMFTSTTTNEWWAGFGLFLYGAVIVSLLDNLLRPKLIGDQAKLHPGLALLGVLGGLHVFGIIGIVIGPIIVAIFFELLHIYKEGPQNQ